MLLLDNKYTSLNLDSYLDIKRFQELEDEFYFLFSRNLKHTKDVWNAGGIEMDTTWPYLSKNPLLYHTYHSITDDKIKSMVVKFGDDKQGLANFLKLKYKSFSPYKILHLTEYQKGLHPWVDGVIADWVKSLPFESVDMVSMFYNDHYCPLKYHRDFNYFPVEDGDKREVPEQVQDLIWFRFDLNRGFNLYNIDQFGNILNTYPVEGYSATFNHYNWHGNTEGSEHPSLTLKVEGKFTEEFKKKIYG